MVSHNVFLNNYYKLSWKRNKKAREARNLIEEHLLFLNILNDLIKMFIVILQQINMIDIKNH